MAAPPNKSAGVAKSPTLLPLPICIEPAGAFVPIPSLPLIVVVARVEVPTVVKPAAVRTPVVVSSPSLRKNTSSIYEALRVVVAVNAPVPLPSRRPVKVVAPVPPFATVSGALSRSK